MTSRTKKADPTSKFTDNGEIFRAMEPAFTAWPDWNRYCFLVASYEVGSYVIRLRNSGIPNWGASVGDLSIYWTFGANEGGWCVTAFNDEDNNNRGGFAQKIRYTSQNAFFKMHKHLFSS